MFLRRIALALAASIVCLAADASAQSLTRRSPDSPTFPAPPFQAPEGSCPPPAILFTQNSSQTFEAANGVACALQPPSPPYHANSSWWRSFRLEDFGLLGPVQLCQLEFGVEQAQTPGATGQPIVFNVGVSLGDPFPLGYRYQLGTVSTTLPDMVAQLFVVSTSIQLPAGSEVYIEVQVPDGREAEHILFPGGNTQPETAPAYFSSTDCTIDDPVTLASIGFPGSHPIINFRGTEIPIAPSSLVFDSDPNYVVDVGDSTDMQPGWTNFFGTPQAVTSAFTSVHAQGGLLKGLADATANYGTMANGVPTSCVTTGDCPILNVAGTKIFGVDEDVFVSETLSVGAFPDKIWDVHVGGSFADVPDTSIFYRFIETLLHRGVTAGCGGGNYCPTSTTTRQQMAVFVLLSKEGQGYLPPACEPPNLFADVPETNPFCRFIEELANRGVVAGCGGGNYCPGNPVTREQMAVFTLKTLDPSLDPPPCVPPNDFNDVPESSGFCRWIEELARRGVVAGCGGGNYCPTNPVTRQQMGPFLSLTFGLTLYGP
jgi:hypothetical protein